VTEATFRYHKQLSTYLDLFPTGHQDQAGGSPPLLTRRGRCLPLLSKQHRINQQSFRPYHQQHLLQIDNTHLSPPNQKTHTTISNHQTRHRHQQPGDRLVDRAAAMAHPQTLISNLNIILHPAARRHLLPGHPDLQIHQRRPHKRRH